MPLHPQAQAWLDAMRATGAPPMHTLTPEQVRAGRVPPPPGPDLQVGTSTVTLEQVLGREEAATLMEHLHPRRWDELATKADIESARADIEALRSWTAERFEAERAWTAERFEAERAWTAERFGRVEANIEGAKQEVLATVRSEMNRLITTQTRTIVFALVAALTANTGLVLTVVRFG